MPPLRNTGRKIVPARENRNGLYPRIGRLGPECGVLPLLWLKERFRRRPTRAEGDRKSQAEVKIESAEKRFVHSRSALRYALKMDINKMLADLRVERDQISEAIVVLERLTIGQGKRRGRPPKWLTEVKRRGRPKGSKNKPKPD